MRWMKTILALALGSSLLSPGLGRAAASLDTSSCATQTITLPHSGAVAPQVQTIAPPAGLDLATASAQELACYHLPPRPSDPQAAAQWADAMAQARTYVQPQFTEQAANVTHSSTPTSPPGGVQPNTIIGTGTNKTWAGYVVTRQDQTQLGYPYNSVNLANMIGEWYVPYATGHNNGVFSSRYDVAPWVGLGGYNQNQYLRACLMSKVRCHLSESLQRDPGA